VNPTQFAVLKNTERFRAEGFTTSDAKLIVVIRAPTDCSAILVNNDIVAPANAKANDTVGVDVNWSGVIGIATSA
jgi:hypothetical protein